MARVPTTSMLAAALAATPRSEWTTSNAVAKAFLMCPRLHYINRILCWRGGVDESRHEDVLQNAWIAIMSPDESGAAKILSLDNEKDSIYSYMWMFIFYSVRSLKHKDHDNETANCSLSTTEDHQDEDSEKGEKFISHQQYGVLPNIDEEVIDRLDKEKATKTWNSKLAAHGWPESIPRDASHFIRLGRPRKIDQETAGISSESLDDLEIFDHRLMPSEITAQAMAINELAN